MLKFAHGRDIEIPGFIVWPAHPRLPVVCPRGSPTENVGWSRDGNGICRDTKAVQPADELLIEISSQRQRPATNLIKRLSRECEAGMKSPGGVFLFDPARVVAEHL